MASKQIPVYLFVGMLESGKTKFIQETMEDPQFDSGDKTLLLVCEEGEEEYDPDRFGFGGVTVEVLADKSELNAQNLERLAKKSGCGRVVIEYNGMWLLQDLADALPQNWVIYQCLATADGTTVKRRSRPMRATTPCARCCWTSCAPASCWSSTARKRSTTTKAASSSTSWCARPAAAVTSPMNSATVRSLTTTSPTRCRSTSRPRSSRSRRSFSAFSIWTAWTICRNTTARPCASLRRCARPRARARTCCVQDIQFVGFPCRYDAYKTLKQRDWITLTAKVNLKYHPIYKGQTPDSTGPVLTAVKVEPAEKPLDDVVMFS